MNVVFAIAVMILVNFTVESVMIVWRKQCKKKEEERKRLSCGADTYLYSMMDRWCWYYDET